MAEVVALLQAWKSRQSRGGECMKKGIGIFLIFMMITNTAVWAQEEPVVEMTAFEKKIIEELPKFIMHMLCLREI